MFKKKPIGKKIYKKAQQTKTQILTLQSTFSRPTLLKQYKSNLKLWKGKSINVGEPFKYQGGAIFSTPLEKLGFQ